MKTVQTFILLILLFAVNSYPQDSFVPGVELTPIISASLSDLEGLTSDTKNEGVKDEGNLLSTTEQGSLTDNAPETTNLETENADTMKNIDSSSPPTDEEILTFPVDSSPSTLDLTRSLLDSSASPSDSSAQTLNSTAPTLDVSTSTLDSSPASGLTLDSTTSSTTLFDSPRSMLDSSAPMLNLSASSSESASTFDSSASTINSSASTFDVTTSTLESSQTLLNSSASIWNSSASSLDLTSSTLDLSEPSLDLTASMLDSSKSMFGSIASTLDSSRTTLDSSTSALESSQSMLDSSASTIQPSESVTSETVSESLSTNSSSTDVLEHSTTESTFTESITSQKDTKGDEERLNRGNSANGKESTDEMYSIKGLRVWSIDEDGVSRIESSSRTEESVDQKEENVKGTANGSSEPAVRSGTIDEATIGSPKTTIKSETVEAIDAGPVSEEGAELRTIATTESPKLVVPSEDISESDGTADTSRPFGISTGLNVAEEIAVNISDLEIEHSAAPGVTKALELTEETEGTPLTQKVTEPNTAFVSEQGSQTITALKIEVNQISDVVTVSETASGIDTTTPTPIAESQTSKVIESNQAPIDPTTFRPLLAIPSFIPSICTEAGNFSNPSNCRLYYICTGNSSNLVRQEGECPPTLAFCPILRRCSRDISTCAEEGPICVKSGSIADPSSTSAYYWCLSNKLGGFHKYHVQCSSGEIFNATFGRCLSETPVFTLRKSSKGHSTDRDVVKAEWKMLKKALKAKSKEEKIRQKMEAKAKAHAEKLAAKEQKKQKGPPKRDDDDDDDDDDEDDD